jgi:general secretion pathway protein K
VLVIVLVTLFFTSFALVNFIEQASNDLLVEARAATAKRLRLEAYSALEVTLATLQDFSTADHGLHSPAEGWSDPLGFAGWAPREGCTAEVTFEDESGKISLPHVDAATLVNLFKAWEMPQADAERLADALLGWMRRDYVASSGLLADYDQGEIPYDPPGRSLRSFSELAAIVDARDVFYDQAGRPNDRWRRFAAAFSLFNFTQPNLNAMPADALSALGVSDPQVQQRMADYLAGKGQYASQGARWFTSAGDAAGILGATTLPAGAGAEIRALRVNITLREGRAEFHLSAVVAPPGGATLVATIATPVNAPATSNVASGAIPTSAAPAVAPSNPAPKLKYPFTLLEIRENAVMSAPPPAA